MKLCARAEDALALVEMGDEAEDLSLLPEAQAEIEAIAKEIETMRLTTLLTGEYDSKNAILTFHAGSGGTGSAGLGRDAVPHVQPLGGAPRLQGDDAQITSTATRPASRAPLSPWRARTPTAF